MASLAPCAWPVATPRRLRPPQAELCPPPPPGSLSPTLDQVVSGVPLHLRAQLPGFLKILQDEDVGGKVDHVLLSAANGQAQEVAEVAQGRPHDVSWQEGGKGWAGGRASVWGTGTAFPRGGATCSDTGH